MPLPSTISIKKASTISIKKASTTKSEYYKVPALQSASTENIWDFT